MKPMSDSYYCWFVHFQTYGFRALYHMQATAKEAQDKITEASAGSPNYHNVGLM